MRNAQESSGRESVLYGRSRELLLVREFLLRPERGGVPVSRPVPVLAFTGTRGSGKTALLDELAAGLEQNVPFARLNCAQLGGSSPQKALAALAFQLSRPCKGYGTLEFPRLITGQLALGANLDVTRWKNARQQVENELTAYPKISDPPQFLATLASEVLSAVPALGNVPGVVTLGRHLPGLVVGGLNALSRGRRERGDGRKWFGHQDKGLGRDPIDVLVELNHKARSDDGVQEVGEVLWAAFLADLRDGFRRGRHADRRTLNCAVLFDDVDAGLELLSGLDVAHRQRGPLAVDDPDPLTVVATSSKSTLIRRLSATGEEAVSIEAAGYKDYAQRVSGRHRIGTYVVRLDDLSAETVGTLVAALGPRLSDTRRITALVHGFAHGHPRATRMLLDAMAELRLDPTGLDAVLDAPMPDESGDGAGRVADRMLATFLADVPSDVVEDLVTCAAARNIDQALRLARYRPLLLGTGDRNSVVFDGTLWSGVDGAGARTMIPVLRRLLLRRLADRAEHERADWASVHGWLRRWCEQDQDQAGELHHALALGEVEFVTRKLADLLDQVSAGAWLDLLRSVCAAPSSGGNVLPPVERVRELTRWALPRDLPVAPLARLVVALWTVADPFNGTRYRELDSEIAADFDDIAPYAGDGLAVLRAEADKYR
ncbi:ATP-binding protein [Saccharopolyspora gloriosae]|uniref:ATP-binding protein n=1 Tax=Saccharopolyspora gloriosae TaxID=455344 RepID=UPI001FB5AB32|nr:ATP-binding protein [Saccharopolyspora gloriosae]